MIQYGSHSIQTTSVFFPEHTTYTHVCGSNPFTQAYAESDFCIVGCKGLHNRVGPIVFVIVQLLHRVHESAHMDGTLYLFSIPLDGRGFTVYRWIRHGV